MTARLCMLQKPAPLHLAVVDDMDAMAAQIYQIALRIVMQVGAGRQPHCASPPTRKVVQDDAGHLRRKTLYQESPAATPDKRSGSVGSLLTNADLACRSNLLTGVFLALFSHLTTFADASTVAKKESSACRDTYHCSPMLTPHTRDPQTSTA